VPSKKQNNFIIEMEARPENLALIRLILQEFFYNMNLSKNIVNDIVLSITEGVANIIKHVKRKKFSLNVKCLQHQIELELSYLDWNFNLHNITLPDFSKLQDSGYGIFLMKKLMSETKYIMDKQTGRVCLKLVKKLE